MKTFKKISKSLIITCLCVSSSSAQSVGDGLYYSSNKKVMNVEVEGYGHTNLVLIYKISTRTITDPLATKTEKEVYRIDDDDDKKNYYYKSEDRVVFLQDEGRIVHYTLAKGDGGLSSRIAMVEVFGTNKKEMKKNAPNPDSFKDAAIKYEQDLQGRIDDAATDQEFTYAVQAAENQLVTSSWGSAIKKFNLALEIKPGDAYCLEKIEMCEGKLAEEDAARQAQIDARTLPDAIRKDAAFEKECLTIMKAVAKRGEWNETFNKVICGSAGWHVVKNNYGIILRRTQSIYAVASWPDGHCTYQSFTIAQEYEGIGNYSSSYQRSVGSQRELPCANAQ